MNDKRLKKYLFEHGFLNGDYTAKEIEQAKKEWIERRKQSYQKQYKKKHHRKELLFTNEEWKGLEMALKKHNEADKNMSQFLKACIFAYLHKGFILPDDEAVQSVELELRRVGVLINQIAKKVNTNQYVIDADIRRIQEYFFALEAYVEESLRTPKTLETLLDEYGDSPQVLDHLEALIHKKRTEL